MGLALDEPKEGDRTQDVEGVEFAMAERDARLLLDTGPVSVQYADSGFHRGYRAYIGSGQGGFC